MNPDRVLRDTLSTVLAELERLEPASLIAARARGVLDMAGNSPAGTKTGKRRGRPPSPIIAERTTEIIERYRAGESAVTIGAAFKINPASVLATLRRAGEPIRPKGSCQSAGYSKEASDRMARIQALHDEGLTLEQIGQRENITRERVRQLCNRAGILTRKTLTPVEVAAVQRYIAGDSLVIAAESIGISERKMKTLIAKAGHQVRPANKLRRRHPGTLANAERAAELYASGKTLDAIGRVIGVQGPTVYRLLAIAGVKPDRQRRSHLNGRVPVGQAL